MKEFAVIGLGDFGMHLAAELAAAGNQVIVIDQDKRKIEAIKDSVNHALVADVKDKSVFSEYLRPELDAVIVAIGRMEASILAVLYLKELGIKHIAVKPVSDDHAMVLRALGADEIIDPDKEMAKRFALTLSKGSFVEHILLSPEYSISEVAVSEKSIGKTLAELKLREKYKVNVIAVKDVMQGNFDMLPDADYRMKVDSALVIIGKESDIMKLKEV
ncbi:MAG: potassium channel family protein [Candidatus Goldiibacteriota bacterium]